VCLGDSISLNSLHFPVSASASIQTVMHSAYLMPRPSISGRVTLCPPSQNELSCRLRVCTDAQMNLRHGPPSASARNSLENAGKSLFRWYMWMSCSAEMSTLMLTRTSNTVVSRGKSVDKVETGDGIDVESGERSSNIRM
jgi:hypothetical protein